MPTPTADTAYRRSDARATLLAVEYYDKALTATERVILSVAASILERPVAPNPNGPMTQEQRAALFAAFSDVFGHSDQATRHAFTGMVLGRNDRCSWAANGGLTYGDASKVLDALDVLNA